MKNEPIKLMYSTPVSHCPKITIYNKKETVIEFPISYKGCKSQFDDEARFKAVEKKAEQHLKALQWLATEHERVEDIPDVTGNTYNANPVFIPHLFGERKPLFCMHWR